MFPSASSGATEPQQVETIWKCLQPEMFNVVSGWNFVGFVILVAKTEGLHPMLQETNVEIQAGIYNIYHDSSSWHDAQCSSSWGYMENWKMSRSWICVTVNHTPALSILHAIRLSVCSINTNPSYGIYAQRSSVYLCAHGKLKSL